MYLLEITYFLAFIFAFRYWSILQVKNLPLWTMPLAFSIKMLVAVIFLAKYLHPDSNNFIPSDTMRFLSDGAILRNVYTQSPKDYFSLLFGFGDEMYFVKKYLSETEFWDTQNIMIANDSRNIIKIQSLIHFISFGKPVIHSLFMCFISLIGLKNLFIAFKPYTSLKPLPFFLILLLFPSLLFWTSGILKEPFLFLGLSILIRALLIPELLLKRIILGFVGIIILLSIKPYVLLCMIPATIFYILYKYIFKAKLLISILTFLSIGISIVVLFPLQREKLVKNISRKQYDFDHLGKGGIYINGDTSYIYFEHKDYESLIINKKDSILKVIKPTPCLIVSREHKYKPKTHIYIPDDKNRIITYNVNGALSYIKTTPINNSFSQLIKNIPEALLNSYFRPFPSDPGSTLKYPAMIETWIITLFLMYSIYKRRKLNKQEIGLITSLIIFSLFLFIIIGWTTPIIGAIYRYRLPAQLAILLIATLLFQNNKKTELKK